jgi:hypothetical protein
MKRIVILFAVLALIAVGWFLMRRRIPSTIDYQGEKIKLTKYYLSYEDYKDDPDSIDPSEAAHVYRLVTEAPIPSSFASRQEMIHSEFDLKFPGYGLGFVGESLQRGAALQGFSVEIPLSGKDRYVIYREVAGRYVLVDDFIAEDSAILLVREEGGKLTYCDRQGKVKLVHERRSPREHPAGVAN